jgi:AraC family transcriptional regulator of adaptative response / DNA-3-methyladenine glycosylase II
VLLDPRACYGALRARDARFDGRFFVGVSSTGIYCRPVCTVRAPRRENCSFFRSAAAAEAGGYRPCLRCRPELAPGFAAVDAPARLARRAASLIEENVPGESGLESLASRLGVTSRHLRRVFAAEFGVAPVQYAQTQRLLMAKRLLTDTAMPVTEVAMASGFASLRRFNALFRERYRMAPTRLRASAVETPPDAPMVFEVAFRPPYDWMRVAAFLGTRSIAGVESVSDGVYRRTVRVEGARGPVSGWIGVRPRLRRHTLEVTLSPGLASAVPQVLGRVRRLFDTGCRPEEVAAVLGELAQAAPGLRVPGAFDGFELAVRAILGQQVSVRAAHTLAGRIAARFGEPVATPHPALHRVFPTADAIAACDPAQVAALGVVRQRAAAIVSLARAIVDGRLVLDEGADVDATLAALQALPGIGAWTAQYVAMRALGWPDAFPATDLGVLKALGVRTAAQAQQAAQHWRPWRSYAVLHLWHRPQASATVREAAVPAGA